MKHQKMDTCFQCKGTVNAWRIDYMAHRNETYLLVKDLPVEACSQCGEIYLDAEASRRVDIAWSEASNTSERLNRVP